MVEAIRMNDFWDCSLRCIGVEGQDGKAEFKRYSILGNADFSRPLYQANMTAVRFKLRSFDQCNTKPTPISGTAVLEGGWGTVRRSMGENITP